LTTRESGSLPAEARRAQAGRAPALVAALVVAAAVVVCIGAIVPLRRGLPLFAITVWFSIPGILGAWLMYAPAPGRGFAAAAVGPIWGYGISSAVLLAMWTAGIRGTALLVAPLLSCAAAAGIGRLLRGTLTPPAFGRGDVVAGVLLLGLVPAIVGWPFARVGEVTAEGKAYRAYFTADMTWRMAVVAEVSTGTVPPRNPFLRGQALHYYWLPHLLPAAQYRALERRVSLEQVLLVNSIALGLAFVLFLYAFVRHWVESPTAAAIATVGAFAFTSFEGLERIIYYWGRGEPWDNIVGRLKQINIDGVTRWYYGSLPIDGLQRLLWYQPHHSTGYALGLSALLVLVRARTLTAALLAFCGCLLGLSLLFSTFAAIMLTSMVALTALGIVAAARQWRMLAIGAVAGAVPLAIAVWVADALRYIDTSGPALARVMVNPMAVTNITASLVLSFGPMLVLAIAGAVFALRRDRARWLAVAAVVVVSIAFYFFVDVVDHQYVYVGWRSGHFLFVAFAALTGYALQEAWRLGKGVRVAAAVTTVMLAALAAPTFIIDFYNTQDITNRSPEDPYTWTLVLSQDELAAFAWIRTTTPREALVQIEPHAREGRRWADIPAFAERRMSAGLPISMVPVQRYEEASQKVLALYRETDPDTAFTRAAGLGIDYIVIGGPERRQFPDFEATLRARPHRFHEVFRRGDVSIFMLYDPRGSA
jgi:hypothetical protein